MFFDLFKPELDDTGPIKKLLLRFEFFGVAKPTIKAYVNGRHVTSSEKKNSGVIVLSEAEYPEFLKQGTYLKVYLSNTQTDHEIRSELHSFFVISKADSKNGWNPPPITYISDSDSNKSMILPPVAAAKGKIYHFKYFGTKRPFILMSALKIRAYPLTKSELIFSENDSLADLFESTIEGTWKFEVSLPNQCVSVVSDGQTWLVVNNYEGIFTSIGAGPLPANPVIEQTKSHFLNYYWTNDGSNNLVLSDLRQNSLKFLHVHRFLPDTGILNIYAPPEVGIERTDCSGTTRAFLSLSLSNKARLSNTASFILSYFNKRIYILSYYDGEGFTIAEYPKSNPSIPITPLLASLTIAGNDSCFQLPVLATEKQETKFYIIKNKSQGKFLLASAQAGQTSLYTPKNGLRDCITYTRPLKQFCFWILVYQDQQLGGQTTAIVFNKYYEE